MATGLDDTDSRYDAPHLGADLFADLPGVTGVLGPDHRSLDTTYYDTPDLRLARAGVTLRRRADGEDAGWHATLPGGSDHSALHVPAARAGDGVPTELAELVRAYTGDRPLGECAHVVTERDAWRLVGDGENVLAEVADDSVRSQALGDADEPVRTWHEVDVVLAAGGPDLLTGVTERLSGIGVTPSHKAGALDRALGDRAARPAERPLDGDSSAGAVVTAYLRTQARRLRAADTAVRLDEPTGVHDFRVAVRRLRSCLRVFGQVVSADRTRSLAAELKWLSDVLGDARDAEVIGHDLAQAIGATPAELVLGPVGAQVQRHLARRAAEAASTTREVLAGRRYLDLLAALDGLLADPPYLDLAHQRAATALLPLAHKAYRKTRRAVDAATRVGQGAPRDAALHKVRRSVKRLRYAAEVVEPVVGGPAGRYRRRCKKVQGTLGQHHDLVVLRTVLRELGGQAHLDGGNGFTFGLLHGRADEAAQHRENLFPAQWQRLSGGKARKWMRG
jgi:CHAD domain-containing protein